MLKIGTLLLLTLFLISYGRADKADSEAEQLASESSHALQAENYELAERLFLRAVELSPDVPEYWSGLGMAQAAQKKSSKAKTSYEKALSLLESEDPQRYADQAFILFLLGREAEASQAIESHNMNAEHALKREHFADEKTGKYRIK